MGKRMCIGIVAGLLAFVLQAQTTFERYYGGIVSDLGNEVLEASNGDFLIVGYTGSFGHGKTDVYIIRVNNQGDTLWTRTYGTALFEWGVSIQPTDDGGYLIAGSNEDATDDYFYFLKINDQGDSLWSKWYGGSGGVEEPFRMIRLSDGNFAVIGYTWARGNGQADVYLLKVDQNADTLWTRTYGGALQDWGFDIAETNDKGFAIAGMTFSYGKGSADMYILRVDSVGDTLWTRTYGGSGYEQARSVLVKNGNGLIVSGYTESFGGGGEIYIYLD